MVEIIEGIKGQFRIETHIVVSVRTFDFPVVSGRVRLDGLMLDAQDIQQALHGMDHVRVDVMHELQTVICLNRIRKITEVTQRFSKKYHGRVR